MIPTRKHCSKCGCWRHAFDFGPDPGMRTGLRAWCKPCGRRAVRLTEGRWFDTCRRGHKLVGSNVIHNKSGSRQCRTCRNAARRRSRKTPEYREYQRIWSEAKRREAGIRRRPLKRLQPVNRGGLDSVPAGPIAEWVKERIGDESRKSFAIRHAVSPKRIEELTGGRVETVSLDTADRILTAAGEPHTLNLLYPVKEEVAA